jgi:hypothetical protein
VAKLAIAAPDDKPNKMKPEKMKDAVVTAMKKPAAAIISNVKKPSIGVEARRMQVRCRESHGVSWSLSWKGNKHGTKQQCLAQAKRWLTDAS